MYWESLLTNQDNETARVSSTAHMAQLSWRISLAHSGCSTKLGILLRSSLPKISEVNAYSNPKKEADFNA
jgi:hypothetical protein